LAQNIFEPKGSSGQAEVVIDNLNYPSYPAEVGPAAELVSGKKN